jgi:hypothetical protein
MTQIEQAPPLLLSDASTVDRRRPGRLGIENPHLIAVLRAPDTDPPRLSFGADVGMQQHFPFVYVLLAAGGFWAALLWAIAEF